MNESLITALDRLLGQQDFASMAFDDVFRDLMEPTLNDLEAFHDEEAVVLQQAHDYLDEYLEEKAGVDGATALKHVSDYLQEQARAFSGVAEKFAEFEDRIEEIGYLQEGYDTFFLSILHYLKLIQMDDVAYRVSAELVDTDQLSADAIAAHVRAIIDNDYYALDHGLTDVRRSYADVLVQGGPE